jgi:hypothetical protein
MTAQGLALFDRAVAFGISGGTTAIRRTESRSRISPGKAKAMVALGARGNGATAGVLRRLDGRLQP